MIGGQVVDWGNRVGQVRALGTADSSGNVLGGYIMVTADDLDKASEIASGCPAITHRGGVEVAEIMTQ